MIAVSSSANARASQVGLPGFCSLRTVLSILEQQLGPESEIRIQIARIYRNCFRPNPVQSLQCLAQDQCRRKHDELKIHQGCATSSQSYSQMAARPALPSSSPSTLKSPPPWSPASSASAISRYWTLQKKYKTVFDPLLYSFHS